MICSFHFYFGILEKISNQSFSFFLIYLFINLNNYICNLTMYLFLYICFFMSFFMNVSLCLFYIYFSLCLDLPIYAVAKLAFAKVPFFLPSICCHSMQFF